MSGSWKGVPGPQAGAVWPRADAKKSCAQRERPPTETTSPATVELGPSMASCAASEPWFTPTSPCTM
jgi:hypothetical protein